MNKDYLEYLCCPKCKCELKISSIKVTCTGCGETYAIKDGVIKIIPNLTKDLELSIRKWDQFYEKKYKEKTYEKEFESYKNKYFDDVFRQLNEAKQIEKKSLKVRHAEFISASKGKILKQVQDDAFVKQDDVQQFGAQENTVYLEIGCGQFFLGQLIADKCKMIIGIDMCPHALKIAKTMLDKKGIKNYLLIQGDILNLPIKNNSINLIYGGGE